MATEAELDDVTARLGTATDGAARGRALDDLAAMARTDDAALRLLLAAVVEHRLAEVSIRKVFLDEDRVDDAVQETVLAVAGGIGGFRGEARFSTWLDRVAMNVARQIVRRRHRLSEPVSNEVPDEAAWVRRISSVVADEVVVERAFARLGEDHRRIIELREMQGLPYDEIATRLGVAVGTVRSRLSRARAELAEHLVDEQRGPR